MKIFLIVIILGNPVLVEGPFLNMDYCQEHIAIKEEATDGSFFDTGDIIVDNHLVKRDDIEFLCSSYYERPKTSWK